MERSILAIIEAIMRLSVQLYTLRDNLARDFQGTLEQVREIGFEFVEGAGGPSAEEQRKAYDAVGLKVNGFHCPIDAIEADVNKVIADANTLGTKYVIVPWIGDDRRGDWAAFGRHLNDLGSPIKDAGLQLAYHNHDFEFVGDGLKAIYDNSSSDLLVAELDLAWVKIGGADPVAWVNDMGTRAPLLHLKDFDPSKNPQWQPAGQGVMDFDAILAAASAAEFGVVELDAYAGDPIDAVRMSFEYFKSKGLS